MAVLKLFFILLDGVIARTDAVVTQWIQERVGYVGIIGVDASRIEDVIDDLCVWGRFKLGLQALSVPRPKTKHFKTLSF